MSLTPLAEIGPAVHLHLWAALLSLGLGPVAIYRRRRDRVHKVMGYLWVSAMALTALSSFGLHAVVLHFYFGFGIIHLLSVYVLGQLFLGVQEARRGAIPAHRARMAGLYWQGLTVAGIFTLLPGRVMNDILFTLAPERAYWVIGLLAIGLLVINVTPLGQRWFAPRIG